ncbi:DUF7144 family membrane protein [Nocardia seriolae]|uniref:DUF7144 domain-containing protein n=1 Tax=Nocardia seriolae TaxID=37332 RepID=A0ABC9YM95_9NOCA|nr:hypothetical protein [Nocardia seriolae]APA99377.1 hypothetical protein NS506_05331 [Nocardia seriolae]OJF81057.1 hypothetical protein NS14008_19975 [Nocardia seriolae]PSK31233.1 hypothetical protein C6575_11380 [Nocardia seriolae]QOW34969.1 hypothetical protein IMZ23_08245 [Nocardia seriolae]QUN17566.1 hypothetical protein KEC46_36745 [Nocardia seriolae]
MAHSNGPEPSLKQGFAAGASIAAGILLIVIGVLSVLQGISAVASDDLLVVGYDYIYKLNTTGWGWIHIILGIVEIGVAIGLLMGTTWGRTAAIVFAALSIVENFLWIPYYPAWSLLIIALDVVVIWGIAAYKPAAN